MIAIHEAVKLAYESSSDPSLWGSILINRRKPHTVRAFLQHEESRICLHRFEACEPADAFPHPHPWPSSMLVLSGVYDMVVSHTADLSSTEPAHVISLTLGPGSIYQMNDPHTWHQVIPRSECYSLMVNGPRWQQPHDSAPTTGGKGLNPLSDDELSKHLRTCRKLLGQHLASMAECDSKS